MGYQHLANLFSDRLPTLPILILCLTDGCNSRCVTCDIWRSPRRNMRPELVDEAVAAVADLRVRWVVLSGGEAMQHPAWADAALRLRAAGARVLLLTNGLLVRKQIDDVISSVDELIVSLDGGTAATYEAIRGVDGFDLILEGIQMARAGGIPVTTRTTVQRANYRELPQIIAAARSVDVNHISFLTVDVSNPVAFGDRFAADAPLVINAGTNAHEPPAHALTADDLPELARVLDEVELRFAAEFESGRMAESPAKLRRMVDYFGAILGQNEFPPVRCNAPHTSAVVEVDGRLRPCYFLPTMGKMSAAMPLRAALNGDDARALRRAYRQGERAECRCCVCPLHKGARSLLAM